MSMPGTEVRACTLRTAASVQRRDGRRHADGRRSTSLPASRIVADMVRTARHGTCSTAQRQRPTLSGGHAHPLHGDRASRPCSASRGLTAVAGSRIGVASGRDRTVAAAMGPRRNGRHGSTRYPLSRYSWLSAAITSDTISASPGQRRHLRVVADQPDRVLPGLLDDLPVAQQRQLLERGGSAGLGGAEHVALPAQLEVGLGQLEAVGGGRDRVQPDPADRCRPAPR